MVDLSALSTTLTLLFVETILLTYLLALSENKDIVLFRKLINALKSSDFPTFYKYVPLWLITLPIAKIAGFLVLLFLLIFDENQVLKTILKDYGLTNKVEIVCFYFAILLFVVRDLGILLLLNFSNRPQRADTSMLVYLVLIYLILPTLTSGLGISVILYPDITQGIIPLIGFPLVEAITVVYFLVKKWQEISFNYQQNS
jgi:biotin transporter BioY